MAAPRSMAQKGYSSGGLNPGPPPWYKQPSSKWPTSQKAPAKKPGLLGKLANEVHGAIGYTKNYYSNKLKNARNMLTSRKVGPANANTRRLLSKTDY